MPKCTKHLTKHSFKTSQYLQGVQGEYIGQENPGIEWHRSLSDHTPMAGRGVAPL